MFKFILSVGLLQQLLQTESLYTGEKCIAEDQQGVCLPLYMCKPIADEVRIAGSPMPHYMRVKLSKLACGFDYKEPMVCCVSSDDFTQEPTWDAHTQGITPATRPNQDNNIFFPGEKPSDTDSVEEFTRSSLDNRNGPKDVEGHPNLDLLPQEQCGIIDGDRIWGGNRTRLFEMPFMVLLSYDSDRGPKLSCGGTIINKWYIMTAAHCVSFLGGNLRLDGVIIGEYDVRHDPDCEISEGQEYCAPPVMNFTIDSVVAHPGYTPQTLVDDIALIRLSHPADFSLESVKPICLPIYRSLQMESLSGLNGVVAGWGVTEDGLQSPVLLSVDLPILSPQECQKAYNGSLHIANTQICAGGVKNKDSCGGDSGGPLLYPGKLGKMGVRYVQRGIVSFGSKRCGIAGFPGVYTNVAYYMDWILDNIHDGPNGNEWDQNENRFGYGAIRHRQGNDMRRRQDTLYNQYEAAPQTPLNTLYNQYEAASQTPLNTLGNQYPYWLAAPQTALKRCNGGASCIALSDCQELFLRLQRGNTPQLTQLLRSLHCGFEDGNIPMICCPPEFMYERTEPDPSTRSSVDPTSLLPNERICGVQNNDRIVGGTQADIDEHPWMALLRYDKPVGWGFYCGGVLISSKYVLTAAHCVKGADLPRNWRLSQVRLGEWNTSSAVDCFQDDCSGPVQDIPIEEIIAHEGYDPNDSNQHNDIALLRLSRDAQFNDFVKPICLPLTRSLQRSTYDGYDMEVAGWGKTETRTESDVKLKVRVPVVPNGQCANVYQRVNRQIVGTQMCAGGVSGQDSCRGDSGGPLMAQAPSANNWMVVGVVSYGPSPCGTQGWPGVYTRVGSYIDWILSKLRP